MATTYLTRTATANNNSVGKWTFSCWVKRGSIASDQNIISFYSTTNYRSALRFESDNKLRFFEVWNGSSIVTKLTNRLFRDTNAWYHIVLAVDKTVSTPDTQIYVNGEAITSWATNDDYTQNESGKFNDAEPIYIGTESGSGGYFDGLISHLHFCDGTKYQASDFGETDSTTGEWKIKTNVSVSYGTNGFFILKDGNSVTDQSGNTNNFTVGGGTLTNTEDCPSDNFATMNPLDNYYTVNTFTNGNTTVVTPSSGYSGAIGAMGASSGKYYFEFKPISKTGDSDEYTVGITGAPVTSINQPHYKLATGYMYLGVNGQSYNNDVNSAYGNTFTAGDIIGVAMDLDNNKLYFSKNGTWQNSGVPTSGSTGTGAISITAPSSTPIGFYLPCCAFVSNSYSATMSFNFGNGYFGTTAISSEGTNASGIGKFEYDVPTGYTALSTKGLNE